MYSTGFIKTTRLDAHVIVVGNVVAGGTGKTPVVMALVDHLVGQGWQVGVLARGYGAKPSLPVVEVEFNSPSNEVGDEPLLIKQRTGVPVFIGRERAAAGKALLAAYPNVQILVCDDGLQHLAMARDLEIGVFDDRGVGNGLLQPAGPLREPWPRPLDFVLHSGQKTADSAPHPFLGLKNLPLFRAQRTLSDFAEPVLSPAVSSPVSVPLAHWQGQPVAAVAGIAQPDVFFNALRARGLNVERAYPRPDHHDFSEINETDSGLRLEPRPLFCTEKDAVKLRGLLTSSPTSNAPPPSNAPAPALWTVPLKLEIDPSFWPALDSRLEALSSRHGQQTA
jgi:tetraacyldisaccharide 4'-kinase